MTGPARRDDQLGLRGAHQTVPLALADDGFDWPAAAKPGETALLRLGVEATARGRLLAPSLEVAAGGVSFRQYFERGARGQRHLNLSPLLAGESAPARGARIGLRSASLRWRPEAELVLCDPPPVEGAAILVLAPHPDDAEIAAFGLYADRSPSPWVATVTAGERGAAPVGAVVPEREQRAVWKAELRVWDSLNIPQLGGVEPERCLNLVYPDGQLESMHRAPGRPFLLVCEDRLPRAALRARNRAQPFREADGACTWGSLVGDLARLLELSRPTVVVCPHPVLDAHSDHVFTAVALDEALGDGSDGVTLLLYAVHRAGWDLHPFGPRRAVVSVWPWTDGTWIADAIYSHPLSKRTQHGKYFAIEAGHDMRPFRGHDGVRLGRFPRTAAREIVDLYDDLTYRSDNRLRRAPRPNEIYYVASRRSFRELVARALGEPRRPPPNPGTS
jgi:LmbE family N-acetylglucosaminyl deacetylase